MGLSGALWLQSERRALASRGHARGVMLRGSAAPRSGWSSYLAVRTGRLRRSPAVHVRPIYLVVFQEPMSAHGGLETSSWSGLRA